MCHMTVETDMVRGTPTGRDDVSAVAVPRVGRSLFSVYHRAEALVVRSVSRAYRTALPGTLALSKETCLSRKGQDLYSCRVVIL